jgi:nitroimidazol reductase NimA-like FMN-containing flavoprotein (pyridoxamine 5'-phosphate oxidase superfamily)
MSVQERETFLADIHVGVLSIPRKEGKAPLTVPIWYDYQPGGEVWLIMGREYLN